MEELLLADISLLALILSSKACLANSMADVSIFKPGTNATAFVDSQTLSSPYSYDLPVLDLDEGGEECSPFPMQECNGMILEEATIDQLQQYMDSGNLSPVKLAVCYRERIQQTDSFINTIIELNPDMMQIAAALDFERSQCHTCGPLHGIPFIVKDNIATKDKMETTAGSWALLGSVVPHDAFVVRRLFEDGALLIGYAGLSEWADMRSNSYSEGYSARGGQARSAYNLTQNPGGSSSGSAGVVAANLVMFALGTETDGSVIDPSSRNASVGIKPTVGLTSRDG